MVLAVQLPFYNLSIFLQSAQHRVSDLDPQTTYNVTVLSVSADGTIVASNNWKSVRTGNSLKKLLSLALLTSPQDCLW